ncbi:MAG TPA: PAS domain S-box protein [Anaeromyxobacteraceae bacterium]|nr:PAS domain S-box protein [Anaeromyxobacteraceae bacterium]
MASTSEHAPDLWIRSEAINSSLNGIAFATLDGTLTSVNAAFLRMWGYDQERDVVGRPVTDFWMAPEKAANILAAVGVGGECYGQLVGRKKSGEPFIAELSASMVRDAQGRPAALMGSFIDVTERTRAVAALQKDEERLRQAIRCAEIGIFDHDQVADVIYWSPRQREIYGVGPDEVITLAVYMEAVHPEDRPRIGEAVRRAHSPGGDGTFDVEHRITRRDGAVRWLTTRAQTFFEGEGQGRRPVRTVGAVRDVTESKLAEDERRRLQEQLAQAQRLESVGRLAGGVAHDFNNMLVVILGNVELLKRQVEGQASVLSDLQEIEQAAQHARELTRQLLAFSRRQVISPKALDLNELLSGRQRTLARLIGEDIQLAFLPAQDLWRVSLDPSQFEQILVNLVVNARDAMPRGGRLTIETANVRIDEAYCRLNAGFRTGDHVRLSVSDEGVGIDKETLPRIFEPFFTTKPLGKGTGLGLATVYGIVAQNGGVVHVYSEPGRGTTFKIYFPRLLAAGETGLTEEPLPPLPAGASVLVVEDDDMVRRVASSMLAGLGLRPLPCRGWKEALELASELENRIDILLTDVVMPEMSGRALRDRIWALRPGLPVLFMSGYTTNVIAHHGVLEAGLYVLQKPFSQAELAKALAGALRTA